jgi:hypothetical protein
MKSLIYLSTALALSIALISCESDTVTNSNGITSLDTSTFIYPFNIGNSWSYTYKIYASDIHPDSIIHYFSEYPLTRSGTVEILYDTIINSIQTRCFLETMIDGQRTLKSRNYMINNDTALLMYAQRGMGTFPPRDVTGTLIYNPDYVTDEEIYIYNPPYTILKYPVVTGRTWNIYGTNNIVKKYEGHELIINSAGTFNCMKTSTVYSIMPESLYLDYYCKYGLLKRSVTFNDIVITTEWFPEGIGTADLTHTLTVNSFNIR